MSRFPAVTRKMLADALLSIRPVDVRILIDSWSKLVLSDRFLYWPQNMFDTGPRREAFETRQMVDRLRRAWICGSTTDG